MESVYVYEDDRGSREDCTLHQRVLRASAPAPCIVEPNFRFTSHGSLSQFRQRVIIINHALFACQYKDECSSHDLRRPNLIGN